MSTPASTYTSPVPKHLAAGWEHTLLVSDLGFFGFGDSTHGELGHEFGFKKYEAKKLSLPVPALSNGDSLQVQVAVGAKHSLMLIKGDVYSTGEVKQGRLGHNEQHGKITFGSASAPDKISFISCAAHHSVAIAENGSTLYTWGVTGPNGCGVTAKAKRAHVEEVEGDAGSDAEADDEKQNSNQYGSAEAYITKPVAFHIIDIKTGLRKQVSQVSCGARHTLALCSDGDVYSWGDGKNGRLGHGGVSSVDSPRVIQKFVVSPEQQIIQICAADSHNLALNKEGKVFSWGSGSYGRLGLGSELDQYTPTMVNGLLADQYVVSIHCNTFHSLAITSSMLYTWGDGKYGKLGHGHERNQLSPALVRSLTKPIQVIRAVCGLHHTVAVTSKNQVYTFGYAASFRCGLQVTGGTIKLLEPVLVKKLDDKQLYKYYKEMKFQSQKKSYRCKTIACGHDHSIVLTQSNNTLLAWGSNSFGQLGTGRQAMSGRPIPLLPFGNNPVVKQVACGAYHSVVLTVKGDIYVWGRNDRGQLGLGDTNHRHAPVLIEALQGTVVESVSCGYYHTACVEHVHDSVASKSHPSNKLYAWGDNANGQCGFGDSAVQHQLYPLPVKMSLIYSYDEITVACGKDHMLVLGKKFKADKGRQLVKSRVYSCGLGNKGQLGYAADSAVYELRKVDYWEGLPEVKPQEGEGAPGGADVDADSDDENSEAEADHDDELNDAGGAGIFKAATNVLKKDSDSEKEGEGKTKRGPHQKTERGMLATPARWRCAYTMLHACGAHNRTIDIQWSLQCSCDVFGECDCCRALLFSLDMCDA